MKKKGAKGRQFKKSKNFNKRPNQRISKPNINKRKDPSANRAPKKTSDIIRSWHKPQQKPVTHKQQNTTKKNERKNNDNLMKTIILNEIKNATPDINRIKQSLHKIKSRGLKQRMKKKVVASGIKFQ